MRRINLKQQWKTERVTPISSKNEKYPEDLQSRYGNPNDETHRTTQVQTEMFFKIVKILIRTLYSPDIEADGGADDTTYMAESEEELKSLLMKVKEENEKASSLKPSKI